MVSGASQSSRRRRRAGSIKMNRRKQ